MSKPLPTVVYIVEEVTDHHCSSKRCFVLFGESMLTPFWKTIHFIKCVWCVRFDIMRYTVLYKTELGDMAAHCDSILSCPRHPSPPVEFIAPIVAFYITCLPHSPPPSISCHPSLFPSTYHLSLLKLRFGSLTEIHHSTSCIMQY